jgi:hypothetical protein
MRGGSVRGVVETQVEERRLAICWCCGAIAAAGVVGLV